MDERTEAEEGGTASSAVAAVDSLVVVTELDATAEPTHEERAQVFKASEETAAPVASSVVSTFSDDSSWHGRVLHCFGGFGGLLEEQEILI